MQTFFFQQGDILMHDKLKHRNCPFCGENRLMLIGVDWNLGHENSADTNVSVRCKSCGAAGPPCKSAELAIMKWDRGANPIMTDDSGYIYDNEMCGCCAWWGYSNDNDALTTHFCQNDSSVYYNQLFPANSKACEHFKMSTAYAEWKEKNV